jgi:hypothetical protein
MSALAASPYFWGVLIGGLAVGYCLPAIIGAIRHIEHLPVIVMLNLFPLAWPAALAGAFILPRKQPPQPLCVPYAAAQYPATGTGHYPW